MLLITPGWPGLGSGTPFGPLTRLISKVSTRVITAIVGRMQVLTSHVQLLRVSQKAGERRLLHMHIAAMILARQMYFMGAGQSTGWLGLSPQCPDQSSSWRRDFHPRSPTVH